MNEKRHDTVARAFVWAVWVLMLAIAAIKLYTGARSIPIGEDWFVINAYTGNEHNFGKWLWQQNLEHRTPLPRAIILLILKATHGQLRFVEACNLGLIAAMAAALIFTASSLRGGRVYWTDAFFPLLLLHLGNLENLLWAWQMQFVSCVTLILLLLILFVRGGIATNNRSACVAGASLVLLPLTGASGLLFVPPLALWLLYTSWIERHIRNSAIHARVTLITCSALSLLISGLYFVGYYAPTWQVAEVSLRQKLWSALRALSLGFGLAPVSVPSLGVAGAALLASITGVLLWRSLAAQRTCGGFRDLGLAVFYITALLSLLALGLRRGGAVASVYVTWPSRYVLLAAPLFCCVYYVWQIYGGGKLQKSIHIGLTLSLFALLPVNAAYGDLWADWLHRNTDKLQDDVQAGMSAQQIVARNKGFLWALDEKDFVQDLERLRSARIAPFALIGTARQQGQASAANSESATPRSFMTTSISYHVAGATEAYLVWGVNGWRTIPEQYFPNDTTLVSLNMRTHLRGGEGLFRADLRVPTSAKLNLGFLIFKCGSKRIEPVYEEDPETPVNVTTVDFRSKLACQSDGSVALARRDMISKQIRYRNDDAAEVVIAWGVDGWREIPTDLRPENTSIHSNGMQTTMKFENGWFTATLRAPPGSAIDYGFIIPRKRGLIQLVGPLWEPGASELLVRDSRPALVRSTLAIRNQAHQFIPRATVIAATLIALLAAWLFLYFAIGALRGEHSIPGGASK